MNYASTANIEEVMKFYNLGGKTFETDFNISWDDMKKFSMTLNWVKENNRYYFTKKRNLATLQFLVMGKFLSEGIANKLASSGLRYEHLKLVYDRDEAEGAQAHVIGTVRVTKTKKIIDRLKDYFKSKEG